MSDVSSDYPRGVEIVGSAVIENDKGEILLVKSHKWGVKWVLPGGHVDPGETVIQAQLREGEEETGLKLKPIAVFTWGELIDPKEFHRKAHFIYFDLYCTVVEGEVKLEERELSEYLWVTPQKALEMDLGENYDKVLSEFIEYRKKTV